MASPEGPCHMSGCRDRTILCLELAWCGATAETYRVSFSAKLTNSNEDVACSGQSQPNTGTLAVATLS